ncbi:Helix-turn-helix domain-containing protein [Propionibacterium cyclohexanicum]|uniref:Helix-turn-helix domain-containing protein n=1 Tax=Propionibacterium cyclohexanicum TaxID=64702 RepID=A0A1H9U5Z5_9ACTN|nr:helix-turn-helix domain-containing protein [Propionibacterium cyclohexanicum]SES04789.1 Helix-turn-helix domain-containing protein [Propionibacterium cyclohexanicum]
MSPHAGSDLLVSRTGFRSINFENRDGRARGDLGFIERTQLEVTRAVSPTYVQVAAVRLDGILVAHAKTRPMTAVWHRDRIDSQNRYLYLFVTKGTIEVDGGENSVIASSEGICIVAPGSAEVTLDVKGDSDIVFFSFDRTQVAPVVSRRPLTAHPPQDSLVFRTAYTYLRTLAHSPEPSDERSTDVLRSLTLGVAHALVVESTPREVADDLVSRARQVIVSHYRSSRFAVDDIARELRVSRRSIERACADQGVKLADLLRLQRTERARELLSEQPQLSLNAVADESGFTSAEVMRRAFRRYFDASPAQIRSTLIAPAADSAGPIPAAGQRIG